MSLSRLQGDAYSRALEAVADGQRTATTVGGGLLVTAILGPPGELRAVTSEATVVHPPRARADVHLGLAVQDTIDGRFVPGLDVVVTLERVGAEVLTTQAPLLWHPALHHYGADLALGETAHYDVRLRILGPAWSRLPAGHEPRFPGRADLLMTGLLIDPRAFRRLPRPAAPRG